MNLNKDKWFHVLSYENRTAETKTIILEMLSEGYELKPQEKVDIFISHDDENFPLDIQHSENDIVIYPAYSFPTWRVFKNQKEISIGYNGKLQK